ncbi:SNP47 protein, partial [Nothocercus nigrocapillus]|nr:SNP47 protein [Nothocercus nigrocapillus]
MNEEIRIHSWPCSYYLDTSKQWVSGRLSLTPVAIKFTADKTGELLVNFHLSGISEIKKESSNLIFSSLTILEKNTKHWFSSLQPNRNVVFNVLEHFWREQLLSNQGTGAEAGALQSTKGKELTGLLAGSQKRLEDTAKVLHYQGEQFDNIMRGLNKIEGDMDVADRYCSILGAELWDYPKRSVMLIHPWEKTPEKGMGCVGLKNAVGLVLVFSLLSPFPWSSNVVQSSQALGCQPARHQHFDLTVSSRLQISVLSSSAVAGPVLCKVGQYFWQRGNLNFLPSCCLFRWESTLDMAGVPLGDKMFNSGDRRWQSLTMGISLAATGLLGGVMQPESPVGGEGMDNEQVQLQSHERISESEAKELKQILKKLKGLALETEAELERQDEALDSITTSVDRATLNIDKQNRRIKKLT